MSSKRNILLTGVGAPGVQGTLYALRELGAFILGTDADEQAVGQYLCDDFHTLPPAAQQDHYLAELKSLCISKQIDVIVPQNTAELLLLAARRDEFAQLGTRILVSDQQAILTANDKYRLLLLARELGIPTGDFELCNTFAELQASVLRRRKKGLMAVVKPPRGNGSRGVRIIVDELARDRRSDFYHQKPSALYCTLTELYAILGDEFPDLLVMDYLPGDEYTVDVMRTKGRFIAIPRKREVMRSGITFRASLEQNEPIINACRRLSDAIGLEYCFGFQFRKDEDGQPVLLECNPRVQGTMVMSVMAGANIIAEAVRSLLGEPPQPMQIDWNTRLVRYWGAVGINETGVVRI